MTVFCNLFTTDGPWGRPATPGYHAPMSGVDKMKNKAEELRGKGKETAGKATDDERLQAEGHGEKVKDVFK